MNVNPNQQNQPIQQPGIPQPTDLSKIQQTTTLAKTSSLSRTTGVTPDSYQANAPGETPPLDPPAQTFSPKEMQKYSKECIQILKDTTVPIDKKNLIALHNFAQKCAQSNGGQILSDEERQQYALLLGAKEEQDKGSAVKFMGDVLSGKSTNIEEIVNNKPNLRDIKPPSSQLPKTGDTGVNNLADAIKSMPTEQFSMVTLLLLLDKLANMSYENMRQMMKQEQVNLNAQFDKQKSEIMAKAITGLAMGLTSSTIQMVSVGMSMRSMTTAESKAIDKMVTDPKGMSNMDKLDPKTGLQVMNENNVPVKLTNAEKFQQELKTASDTGKMKALISEENKTPNQINADKMEYKRLLSNQESFAKIYQSTSQHAGMVQQLGQGISSVITATKEFTGSMFDVQLADVEKEKTNIKYRQDRAQAIQSEMQKDADRAKDAIAQMVSTDAQAKQFIAGKIA